MSQMGQSRQGGASWTSSHVRNAPLATVGQKKAAYRDGPLAEVAQRHSFHRNGDLLGYDRWVEWVVLGIAEHQLQRVLAGWQFNTCLSLPGAEMKMCLVLWDRLVWVERFIYVDQQMMMTAVGGVAARLGDAHVAKAKPAPKRTFHSRAIRRPNNIEKGVSGCLSSLRVRGNRQPGQQGSSQRLPAYFS